MAMRSTTLTLVLTGLSIMTLSAVFADDAAISAAGSPVPPAATTGSTAIFRGSVQNSGPLTAAPQNGAATPATPQDEFQRRLRQSREKQRRQEFELANRPTEWQIQNPSGQQNQSRTELHPSGYIAPNTYFGPQQRAWSGLSAPAYEPVLPYNMTPVPPVTRTDVMLAPLNYWGPDNQRWLQMAPIDASPNPLGGWNTRFGW